MNWIWCDKMVTIVPVDFKDVKFLARPARPIFQLVNNSFEGASGRAIPHMIYQNGNSMLAENGTPMEYQS